ncbi:MAG TPA: hypothetical protein VKY89_00010 [Thermoanaerobaculia bacterium]|nr:hypothetical protein [Thermoanaerobaculia bacterium]
MPSAYVRCVLDLYRSIPETPSRERPADRQLAVALERQGISIEIVAAAFVLATARRHYRDPEAPALSPVRSLHYYLPVIDELRASPPPAGYRESLRQRLEAHAPGLLAAIDHQLP